MKTNVALFLVLISLFAALLFGWLSKKEQARRAREARAIYTLSVGLKLGCILDTLAEGGTTELALVEISNTIVKVINPCERISSVSGNCKLTDAFDGSGGWMLSARDRSVRLNVSDKIDLGSCWLETTSVTIRSNRIVLYPGVPAVESWIDRNAIRQLHDDDIVAISRAIRERMSP